ncbi:hypothetical protein [uncultured Desulfovibrio sp.]|uniref:hypothetical protein n=1 Tax=uncultured Desulfovibrio sp. TaxID=167968 RepID=UPI002672C74B|nr:hypothetical protein [uncultured Desulfovibrio sp.]
MLEYMESPFLTMLLTALVPTFAFSMLNLRHFNVIQILNALAVAGVAGGILFFSFKQPGLSSASLCHHWLGACSDC